MSDKAKATAVELILSGLTCDCWSDRDISVRCGRPAMWTISWKKTPDNQAPPAIRCTHHAAMVDGLLRDKRYTVRANIGGPIVEKRRYYRSTHSTKEALIRHLREQCGLDYEL